MNKCHWENSRMVPLKSGKWANEFPRQITASKPSPGFWISSGNVSQLASSITVNSKKKKKLNTKNNSGRNLKKSLEEFWRNLNCKYTESQSCAKFIKWRQQLWTTLRWRLGNSNSKWLKVKISIPHSSKAGSFLLSHLAFNAYLSILSLASTLTIWNPSSTNIMESTLQNINHTVHSLQPCKQFCINCLTVTSLLITMTQIHSCFLPL